MGGSGRDGAKAPVRVIGALALALLVVCRVLLDRLLREVVHLVLLDLLLGKVLVTVAPDPAEGCLEGGPDLGRLGREPVPVA